MNLVMGLSWILTSALPFPQKKKKKKKKKKTIMRVRILPKLQMNWNRCDRCFLDTQNEFSYGIAVDTS